MLPITIPSTMLKRTIIIARDFSYNMLQTIPSTTRKLTIIAMECTYILLPITILSTILLSIIIVTMAYILTLNLSFSIMYPSTATELMV